MMSIIFGIVLCTALSVLFVLFVHPKSEGGCAGGGDCGSCHSEENCSIAEKHHEQ